jgi:hypothetical protein
MMLDGSIHVVTCTRWICFLDAMVASLFDREKGGEHLWMPVFAIC